MLDKGRYVNSAGQEVKFDGLPYLLDTNSLRDYDWKHELSNNRVVSFNKEVAEIDFTIAVMDDGSVDDCKNHLYEIFEHDVINNKKGKFYIGDWYIKCNITKSKKADYLLHKDHMKVTFTLVSDHPWWIKDVAHSFKGESLDITEWFLEGYTNEQYVSIAENGQLPMQIVTSAGDVLTHTITTEPVRSLDIVKDVLGRNDSGIYGKFKKVALEKVASAELLIDQEYKTYILELASPSKQPFKCNNLPVGAERVEITDVDSGSGQKVVSDKTENSVCHVTIYGTAEGISDFTIYTTNQLPALSTWEGIASKTWGELEGYTWSSISEPQKHEIIFSLSEPLMEGEKIAMDSDGIWKIFRADGSTSYLTTQDALNNLPSYEGYTTVETTGDAPTFDVVFKSRAYLNNRVSNTQVLDYELAEFITFEDDIAIIRVTDEANLEDLLLMYALQKEEFIPFPANTQNFFKVLEGVSIKQIFVRDALYMMFQNDSFYPHGYPWGYGSGLTSVRLENGESVKPSSFTLVIRGEADDPQIIINDHIYRVNETLAKGDYITIDSVEKTITKYNSETKMDENIFHKRFKEHSIFEPIPMGDFFLDWDKHFSFELIIHEERGEPKWN